MIRDPSVVPTEAERSEAQWRDLRSTISRKSLREGPSATRLQRYGKVVTHCEFSIPVKDEADKERLRALAKAIQAN